MLGSAQINFSNKNCVSLRPVVDIPVAHNLGPVVPGSRSQKGVRRNCSRRWLVQSTLPHLMSEVINLWQRPIAPSLRRHHFQLPLILQQQQKIMPLQLLATSDAKWLHKTFSPLSVRASTMRKYLQNVDHSDAWPWSLRWEVPHCQFYPNRKVGTTFNFLQAY